MTPELDVLKRWALYSPRAEAIVCADTGRKWTYEVVFRMARTLAAHLRSQFAIGKGDRVAVLASNEVEYVVLAFAAWRLGAILVPVNHRLTEREIHHILTDSECSLLVHQEAFAAVATQLSEKLNLPHVWTFDGPNGLVSFLESKVEHRDVATMSMVVPMQADWQDAAMILYTSGTTGSPKGAVLTHEMIFWNSVNTSLRLNITSNDCAVIFLPFFHTSGWNVLTTPFLHHGARLVFLRKFEAARVLSLCDEHRATLLFGVPTTMEMMSRTPEFANVNLESIRYAIVGGEPMTVSGIETWSRRGIPIRQGYGLTEFGPNVFSLNEEDALRKRGSIGFPNFYVETRIVDDLGRDVAVGEVGELVLRGPMCMRGYWRNEKATSETIRDGWLCTGDLVRADEEGYHYVVGRKKEMYISGGENVYPAEVEKVISALPGVREVAVVGVEDEKWGEAGRAFLSAEAGVSLSEESVRSHCLSHLAKYKVPRDFVFLSELPKGDSGKILKRMLEVR